MRQLFSFQYFATIGGGCENELCLLLVGRYNGEATPNMARAYGMRWATLAECMAELKLDPAAYTPWAQIALRALMDTPLGRELAATTG